MILSNESLPLIKSISITLSNKILHKLTNLKYQRFFLKSLIQATPLNQVFFQKPYQYRHAHDYFYLKT